MRTRILMMAALVSASALALNAQTPQPPTPQTQPPTPRTGDTTQRTATAPDQVITITGCLKEEKDVAGLTPNPAERVGVTEDYILTDVKMAQSSPVSGIGVAARYEIEGIAEAELKKHLNHQVELTGRITQATATEDDKTPDFAATSIKMVSASCAAPK